MKRVKILIPVLGTFLLMAVGCKKDVTNNISDSESRIYITKHDSTANFTNYQTFGIADSVSLIKDGKFLGYSRNAFDSTLITALSQQMQQRGYQLKTESSAKPDLILQVSRLYTDYSGVISYDDFWNVYGGYWDPYYWGFGGYGYYFPYVFDTYTVRDGALSINMIDLKNPDTASKKLHSIWTAIGRGVGIFDPSNVNEEVNAFFSQSTYLRR